MEPAAEPADAPPPADVALWLRAGMKTKDFDSKGESVHAAARGARATL